MSSRAADGGPIDPERPTEPLEPDKSLGDLLSDLTSELGELFRDEVQLAKVETAREVAKAARATGMATGAALAVWLAALLLSLAGAWLLDDVMHRALAFALVGVAWAATSGILGAAAMKTFRSVRPDLPDTTTTLKEDIRWARANRP